ncbi:MAG: DNA alkylation repair protein [Prolixibacteraceae bacterium]|nr:DNA alkylation repair protein [Prolixibacteraceae bacterium]
MPEKLKDILFPREKVQYFADTIKKVYPPFNADGFIRSVCDSEWPDRELKEKMRHTTLCLHNFLPTIYQEAIDILLKIIPDVKGFEAIVLPDYVEVYGLNHWEISLPALGEFTKCGSSEFGIRPFLNKDLKSAMVFMNKWAENEDFKVRRFASEGCRPLLPWAAGVPALKKDPSLILPILEKLKDDPEEFVRKSVANNLNDISKSQPKTVLEICERWQGHSDNTDWIIKHACRTLLKQGNKRAMMLFGFANPDKMKVENFKVSNATPKIGDDITFSFDLILETDKKQKVRIEYITHYVKANGKTSPKVFQIKEVELKPGVHSVKKKHSFVNMSTRKHYPGEHTFEIVINGEKKDRISVHLG